MSKQRIIWLASYPKSGNTWTRYFLANYFLPKDQAPTINEIRRFTTADVRQDFYDKAAGKPFVSESVEHWLEIRQKAVELIALSKPGTHFVKTHSRIQRVAGFDLIPPALTAAAVYVIRNPFDLAPSYARHVGRDIDVAIELMQDPEGHLKSGVSGIYEMMGTWDSHIATWLGAPGLPRHVLRYEDMTDDPEKAFRGLLGFLRVPVNDGQLRRAIRASSFEAMKKQEQKDGFIERPAHMTSFFAKGRAGSWREDLTPEQVRRIREAFLPTIEKFWPELAKETDGWTGPA